MLVNMPRNGANGTLSADNPVSIYNNMIINIIFNIFRISIVIIALVLFNKKECVAIEAPQMCRITVTHHI
jgi:hypothetical protein